MVYQLVLESEFQQVFLSELEYLLMPVSQKVFLLVYWLVLRYLLELQLVLMLELGLGLL